ncbi:MAG: hypothetical protein Q9163_002586 [Psora crenata]
MADDDPGEEGDERTIELSAIAAIYPELIIHSNDGTKDDDTKATLSIDVEPVSPLPIHTPNNTGGTTSQEEEATHAAEYGPREVHYLSHLPPLNVQISLPEGYPATQAPAIKLSTQEHWLASDKLQELETSARTLWENMGHDQVLYAYIDQLREAAEGGFGLHDTLQVSPGLLLALLDFDHKAKKAKFERESFECGVCLEPKKGSACHRLQLCSHVFCVDCLQDFYNNCIIEGNVGKVKCMAPKCGEGPAVPSTKYVEGPQPRADRTLEPSELLQIPLKQDTVQRYIKLRRKKQLESDRTTVYCPRQWCQGPARTKSLSNASLPVRTDMEPPVKTSDQPEVYALPLPPPADRLAICEDCTFAFCLVCKASWHGEYFKCFPRSQFEITAEERASEEYMKLHTQPCPTCDARAQKSFGCNHMICLKCDTHYCYLCGAYLERENPYEHFNNKFKGCYMRLWELEGGDDGEIGHAFAGGPDGGPLDWDTDDDDDSDDEHPPLGAIAVPPAAPAPPPARRAEAMIDNAPPLVGDRRLARRHEGGGEHGHRHRDGAALRRFLDMVLDDVEDEWDSDEMSWEEMEELEG